MIPMNNFQITYVFAGEDETVYVQILSSSDPDMTFFVDYALEYIEQEHPGNAVNLRGLSILVLAPVEDKPDGQ
jgi:hypothetical protein